MADRKLIVKIIGDSRSVEKAFKRSGAAATGFRSRVGSVIKGMAVAGIAAAGAATAFGIAFGVKAVKAAMRLNQSLFRVNKVFGSSAGIVRKWSEGAANAFALTEDQALDYAGALGNTLRPMGFGEKAAALMSKRLVGLAADLAEFNKADPADTSKALQRGLTGMMRGLKQYGIVLDNATVKQRASEMFHTDPKALTSQQLAMARYRLILEKSALAQGTMAKRSNTLHVSLARIRAVVHNLTEVFGQGLLPVVTHVANVLSNKLADPKFRAFVQHLGHQIGVTLYNAFVSISAWFKKNWPAIKQGFIATAAVVKRYINLMQRWVHLLQRIGELANKYFGWAGAGTGDLKVKALTEMEHKMGVPKALQAGIKGGWLTASSAGNVYLDGKKVGEVTWNHHQRKKNRHAGQTRGRHGGDAVAFG